MNEGTRGAFKILELVLNGGVRAIAGTGAPTNGTSGTGVGRAVPGSIYTDSTNSVRWLNVGTTASPVWTPVDVVSFAISSANILAMFGTPVNLIAAPPAGYAIVVNNVLFTMTRTATAYANGGVVSFVYTGGAVAVATGTVPAATITGAAGTALTQLGPATVATGTVVPTATGVDITNATAAFITGTGTAVARISYSVVKQAA